MESVRHVRSRTALISGGSRGIGLEVAKELALKGVHVILVARDQEKLQIEKSNIEKLGGKAEVISINFLHDEAIEIIRDFLVANRLVPTILVNGLGGGFGSSSFDSLKKFEEVMRLNFFVAHELTKIVLEYAKIESWGRFIYLGTLAINLKSASAPYIASKAALIEYMKTVNKEFARISPDILAAAVSPGAISVPGKYLNKIEKSEPEVLAEWIRENKIPVGRLGTTKEVAEVISFLCDEKNRYLHGCNIQIDGGASN